MSRDRRRSLRTDGGEEHPWLTRALPLWNLLTESKELVLLDGVGHNPPADVRVAPVNAFLDKVFGPVSHSPAK